MTLDPIRAQPPGQPSFAPVPGHLQLRSDTPILAAMLLSGWREQARMMLDRVNIRPADRTVTGPIPLLLEASKVIDPDRKPAWVRMRDDWLEKGGESDGDGGR